jgi:hypothetical protein
MKRWLSIAGLVLFLIVVFCLGFAFFYYRIQRTQKTPVKPGASSKSLIDKPLPHADMVDVYGARVDEQVIRTGRVVVVFVTPDCDACKSESKFLGTLLDRRKDVAFYGIVPFGTHPESPDETKKTFPFRVFYDESSAFVATMGLNRIPVKVFLEDGIIKKGWIGAALTDESKESFVTWLDSLP